jgi:predicted kinase
MCGLPFAGKSSFARQLASDKDATLVELDAVNTELGIGLTAAPIQPDEWARSYAESYRRIEALLHDGRSVIFDAASFTRAQRDERRAIAFGAGAAAVVVYLRLTKAEVRRRMLENRRSRIRHDIRDENFANVADNFEEPRDDERVWVIEG